MIYKLPEFREGGETCTVCKGDGYIEVKRKGKSAGQVLTEMVAGTIINVIIGTSKD